VQIRRSPRGPGDYSWAIDATLRRRIMARKESAPPAVTAEHKRPLNRSPTRVALITNRRSSWTSTERSSRRTPYGAIEHWRMPAGLFAALTGIRPRAGRRPLWPARRPGQRPHRFQTQLPRLRWRRSLRTCSRTSKTLSRLAHSREPAVAANYVLSRGRPTRHRLDALSALANAGSHISSTAH
jgi:hypothetical protein